MPFHTVLLSLFLSVMSVSYLLLHCWLHGLWRTSPGDTVSTKQRYFWGSNTI